MDEKKKHILVVEDQESLRDLFKLILESEGYEVDTAKTGQEAIEKLEVGFYNLALLDIRLPDMDGTEVLSKMHMMRPKMIKIMITGYPTLENAVASLNLGANAYVIKPIQPEELLKVIMEKLKEKE